MKPQNDAIEASWGPNPDASVRTAFLGVRSDCFGRGIGSAVQDFTEAEVCFVSSAVQVV